MTVGTTMPRAAAAREAKKLGNIAESLGGHGISELVEQAAGQTSEASAGAGQTKAAPQDGRTRNRSAGLLAIDKIIPDPDQPRKTFDEEELQGLAHSLKKHGQLQAIRVRWSEAQGKWVIIAGERRYRAAQLA